MSYVTHLMVHETPLRHPARSIVKTFSVFLTLLFIFTFQSQGHASPQTLYVSFNAPAEILSFNSNGVASVLDQGSGPFGLAVGPNGDLFAAYGSFSTGSFGIYDYNIQTGSRSNFVSFSSSIILNSIAFDRFGNIYGTSFGDNAIYKISQSGAVSVFANSGLTNPFGIAFDSSGNLFVSNQNSNSITEITPGGVQSVFANTGLDAPRGIAFDQAGNLYVANSANNGTSGSDTIEVFTPAGNGSVFANTGLQSPSALAFDDSGNLYVFNSNDVIEEFSSSGTGTIFATSSAAGAQSMAFSSPTSVPEPSVTGLLCAGLIGLRLIRRSKSGAGVPA